jgi:acetylornithine/LysW-gamma-L-lysine aminotransferase
LSEVGASATGALADSSCLGAKKSEKGTERAEATGQNLNVRRVAEDTLLIPLYQKFPIAMVRGEGAIVYDDEGRQYFDMSGGYGVAIVGHANPRVANAISQQATRLITCHGSLYNDARASYLELLSKHLPPTLCKVYLCNSGAEANEAAIKFARKRTGRSNIVAFTGSYHGKTMGALSATWSQKYRKPFAPLVEGVHFVPFGNLERAKQAIDANTACVIVEPIQGESGIHLAPEGFLGGLRKLTEASESMLIFDEVQSGFGRTGRLWACENWGVYPDIMTASKGVAGGVPFAFCATNESVASSMKPGEHTSTFGGNPLSCAAARAALEFLLDEGLLDKTTENGEHFRLGLERLKSRHPRLVREVRGVGLMLACELKIPVKNVIMRGFDHNLILLYAGLNVLRFLPPLVITKKQLDQVLDRLDLVFDGLESEIESTSHGLILTREEDEKEAAAK